MAATPFESTDTADGRHIDDVVTIELPHDVWVAGRAAILMRLRIFTVILGVIVVAPLGVGLSLGRPLSADLPFVVVLGALFLAPMWLYNAAVVDPRNGYSVFYPSREIPTAEGLERVRNALVAAGIPCRNESRRRAEPRLLIGGASWVSYRSTALAQGGHGTVGQFPARVAVFSRGPGEAELHRRAKGVLMAGFAARQERLPDEMTPARLVSDPK